MKVHTHEHTHGKSFRRKHTHRHDHEWVFGTFTSLHVPHDSHHGNDHKDVHHELFLAGELPELKEESVGS